MSKRENEFINSVPSEKNTSILTEMNNSLNNFHWQKDWPISSPEKDILFKEGSNFKKSFLINLTEKEWNTLERHIASYKNVSKQAWVKNAILNLLALEQQKFLDEIE